ncbi:Hsp20/alpha crystallin family protein [Rubritalea spongiae]|uniref:Hsp20/alpha crystallin family protein n=1 Tax=Rubritalea spongiae TaxID=430797 RepID=A0ABW5DZA6_9BACT
MTNTAEISKGYTQAPKYSTITHDEGVHIHIDLPGVAKEAVSITSEKQQLKIVAKRENAQEESWSLLNQVERPSNYELALNVHSDLDLATTSAQLNKGVLKVSILKREDSLPKKINIAD